MVCDIIGDGFDHVILLWRWMVVLVIMGVRRGIGSVGGIFNCGFESIGCKVYFDIMKVLLPFLIFEFEVVMLMVGLVMGYYVVLFVIVVVMVIELINNGFGI